MSGKKVSTFQERITELVANSNKSQSSIASDFGIAKQTLSAWITGQNSPRNPVATALAEYFGVSLPWLLGFDVPKYLPQNQEASPAHPDMVTFLAEDEKRLVAAYRGANDQAKSDAIDLLEKHQKKTTLSKAE